MKNDWLADFQVAVAAGGYDWMQTHDGPILIERPSGGARPRTYRLFSQQPRLYEKFSQLDRTEQQILAFANEYGWLGAPVTGGFVDGRLATFDSWEPGGRYAHQRGEPLSSENWSDESLAVLGEHRLDDHHAWADHIYALAGFQRAARMRARGKTLWVGNELRLEMSLATRYWRLLDTKTGLPSRPRQMSAADKARREAMEGPFLADRVSLMLHQVLVLPRVVWDERRKRLRFVFMPVSLIGGLWLQAVLASSKLSLFDLRRCAGPGCTALIDVSDDPQSGKRAHTRCCSDTCRQRLSRHRRKRRCQRGLVRQPRNLEGGEAFHGL